MGWVQGDNVFLLPDAAYKVARNMGADSGEGITISLTSLCKRLHEGRWLASIELSRQTYKIRRKLEGQQQQVLHLSAKALISQKPDNSDICDGSEEQDLYLELL